MKAILLALKLNLRKLILISTILSVSGLFAVSIFILNYIIKQQLIQNSLAVNEKYATKVAMSADNQFDDMLRELKYSAALLGQNFSNPVLVEDEVKRIKNQSDKFNSVLIIDQQNRIISFEPEQLNITLNAVYKTVGITQALQQKKQAISSPYWSIKHNLIVMISQPIFDIDQNYLGLIGGSIYLQKKNLINEMLSTGYDFKKSYMYVVDENSRIIFHPDVTRIGQKVVDKSALEYMMREKTGQIQLTNSKGIKNLAGFAKIPTVGWTVVSQQPTEELLKQANTIILKVSIGIFIFYFFIFFLVWKLSRFISAPLNSLAKMASMLNQPDIQEKIIEIDPWYFEVTQFRTSLLLSSKAFSDKITELHYHVNTDPLTGLYNRRGMQLLLKELINLKRDFAVLSIDIDFFKKVNDNFGHDQGDKVLKILASLIKDNFREHDVCCRVGGEEFMVLMTTSNFEIAQRAAERLRIAMQTTHISPMPPVTISIGMAFWPKDSTDVNEVFKKADKKLYEAKNSGRNCIRY